MDLKELTDNQKSTLKQFRELTANYVLPDSDDTFLLKWLVARDFNLTKAHKMLRTSLEWRLRERIDFMLDEFVSPEVMTQYFPCAPIGKDKRQQPLWLFRYGRGDIKGLLNSTRKEDYFRHVVKQNEINISLGKKYQPNAQSLIQSTIIFDMEGLSMNHITHKPTMDIAILVVQNFEANYPELLGRIFVVNAPKILSIGYSIIKPLLHDRTVNKVLIFNQDSIGWKEAILAEVDPDQLPACYGGTLTDPDGNPNCITKCPMGGPVPESFYLSNKKPEAFDEEMDNDKTFIILPSGNKQQFEFQVDSTTNAMVLRWEFYSKTGDLAYAIYHKSGDQDMMVPVVPHQRVNCHIATEKGEINCQNSGSYIVEFDNSYSYLRSKKLWYSIVIEKCS